MGEKDQEPPAATEHRSRATGDVARARPMVPITLGELADINEFIEAQRVEAWCTASFPP